MSKRQPNQDFYKVGGREQSDGPDRAEPVADDRERLVPDAKRAKHPAVQRSKSKK